MTEGLKTRYRLRQPNREDGYRFKRETTYKTKEFTEESGVEEFEVDRWITPDGFSLEIWLPIYKKKDSTKPDND
jgi:hypothetical protein